jgi:hypothetical protein
MKDNTLFELLALLFAVGGRSFLYFFTRRLAGLLSLRVMVFDNLFPGFVSCINFPI